MARNDVWASASLLWALSWTTKPPPSTARVGAGSEAPAGVVVAPGAASAATERGAGGDDGGGGAGRDAVRSGGTGRSVDTGRSGTTMRSGAEGLVPWSVRIGTVRTRFASLDAVGAPDAGTVVGGCADASGNGPDAPASVEPPARY